MGDGTFARCTDQGFTSARPSGVVAADFDNDTAIDILYRTQNGVYLLQNDGRGGFAAARQVSNSTSARSAGASLYAQPVAADVNNDGFLDLVMVSDDSNAFIVMINNKSGSFLSPTPYPVSSQPTTVMVADFNADGNVDIVGGLSGQSKLAILLGKGSGTFAAASYLSVADEVNNMDVGEYNGDGKLDLLVSHANASGQLFLGSGTGTFSLNSKTIFPASGTTTINWVDFDGNGVADVATGRGGQINIIMNQGCTSP